MVEVQRATCNLSLETIHSMPYWLVISSFCDLLTRDKVRPYPFSASPIEAASGTEDANAKPKPVPEGWMVRVQ